MSMLETEPTVAELLASRQNLWQARFGLLKRSPQFSAHNALTRVQKILFAVLVLVSVVCFVVAPLGTGIAFVGFATVAYVASLAMRLWLSISSLDEHAAVPVSVASHFADQQLPTYSVFVPIFKEAEVLPGLFAALGQLDYPKDRLEILIICEGDDHETVAAVQRQIAAANDPRFRRVVVPACEPRTKPKAMNYAMGEARGQLIAVYDAEDRPDPMQLRHAAAALLEGGGDLACVQAQLNYYNPEQNIITKWFTIEYTSWFQQFLPGLVKWQAPIPLGGTSNHFRRGALENAGGWDPYNVTEDADLGLRLHRLGYHVGVIDSVTLEEANSDFVNWIKQRSRWYKGYMQTWLVHIRNPRRTIRTLGWRGFLFMNLFVGGTPLLALLNPVFWTLFLMWWIAKPQFIADLFPPLLYYPGLLCVVVGNFLMLYAFLLTALKRSDAKLVKAAFTIPAYYVMMAIAAYKALAQLLFQASYWEKTQHGLVDDREVIDLRDGVARAAA